MKINVAGVLAIMWFAAAGVAPPALGADSADRAAIEVAAQAWAKAFNARDAKALLAMATEDLVVLDPNRPPVSGAAAREAWKNALGAAQGQLTSASKEIVISGDVAWRIAGLTFRQPARQGQALEIWKRVGGEWKIHRQMSSSVLTQPNLLPTPSEPVLDRPAN
jgi:ketosteroid isomerase-like protein